MVGGKKHNASKRAFGRAGANTCKQRARDHSSSATLRKARDLASPARGCASTGHHRAPRITPHPPATYPPSYICRRASSLPPTCDRKAKGALSHGAVSMGGGDDGDDGNDDGDGNDGDDGGGGGAAMAAATGGGRRARRARHLAANRDASSRALRWELRDA